MSAYDNWLTNAPDDSDDLADSLLHDFRNDAAKVAEADENWSGTLDGDQYSAIESALADLHDVDPCDLLGTRVLETLYRLAKPCAAAREAELLDMARAAAEKQRDEAEDMRAECAAMSRRVA